MMLLATLDQALWTIAIGSVCSVACALLGCFLVLRRMSLLCDAIGHGMLPGIALAVLLTGQVASVPVFLGAMAFGVLTALLSQTLTSAAGVPEDSAMGTVFTALFGVGVILVSRYLQHTDADLNCVLYGVLEFIWIPELDWFGWEVPRAFPTMLFALAATLLFLVLFWKELQLAAFDPALATAMGFNATLLHYLHIALVAGCAVASFQALGSVVVLAMFIVPAATAQLLADRLWPMLLWAVVVALLSTTLGYVLASEWVATTALGGMIATVAGVLFLLAALFAPRHGAAAKALRQFRLTLRMAGEEILAQLYRAEEHAAAHPGVCAPARADEHGFSRWTNWLARRRLLRRRWLQAEDDGGWRLTKAGREQAALVVRAHRLWEAYLTEHLHLPLDHLHAPASRMEHFLGPELQGELARELQQPATDPHGKAIPKS